ncbi:hypothetical protein CBR_g19501 [Chara braunii]|uniref:Uncharacterized protein n=1 Tax=Chara braunii TaxID=69332 RepID=A0A388KY94_CHABU|nr:hypothetical protein CBR_g19501 [Chara braunii]|eukprot:GBG74988.1 hypothetical protein CBR_g19501 [Chara braunii]
MFDLNELPCENSGEKDGPLDDVGIVVSAEAIGTDELAGVKPVAGVKAFPKGDGVDGTEGGGGGGGGGGGRRRGGREMKPKSVSEELEEEERQRNDSPTIATPTIEENRKRDSWFNGPAALTPVTPLRPLAPLPPAPPPLASLASAALGFPPKKAFRSSAFQPIAPGAYKGVNSAPSPSPSSSLHRLAFNDREHQVQHRLCSQVELLLPSSVSTRLEIAGIPAKKDDVSLPTPSFSSSSALLAVDSTPSDFVNLVSSQEMGLSGATIKTIERGARRNKPEAVGGPSSSMMVVVIDTDDDKGDEVDEVDETEQLLTGPHYGDREGVVSPLPATPIFVPFCTADDPLVSPTAAAVIVTPSQAAPDSRGSTKEDDDKEKGIGRRARNADVIAAAAAAAVCDDGTEKIMPIEKNSQISTMITTGRKHTFLDLMNVVDQVDEKKKTSAMVVASLITDGMPSFVSLPLPPQRSSLGGQAPEEEEGVLLMEQQDHKGLLRSSKDDVACGSGEGSGGEMAGRVVEVEKKVISPTLGSTPVALGTSAAATSPPGEKRQREPAGIAKISMSEKLQSDAAGAAGDLTEERVVEPVDGSKTVATAAAAAGAKVRRENGSLLHERRRLPEMKVQVKTTGASGVSKQQQQQPKAAEADSGDRQPPTEESGAEVGEGVEEVDPSSSRPSRVATPTPEEGVWSKVAKCNGRLSPPVLLLPRQSQNEEAGEGGKGKPSKGKGDVFKEEEGETPRGDAQKRNKHSSPKVGEQHLRTEAARVVADESRRSKTGGGGGGGGGSSGHKERLNSSGRMDNPHWGESRQGGQGESSGKPGEEKVETRGKTGGKSAADTKQQAVCSGISNIEQKSEKAASARERAEEVEGGEIRIRQRRKRRQQEDEREDAAMVEEKFAGMVAGEEEEAEEEEEMEDEVAGVATRCTGAVAAAGGGGAGGGGEINASNRAVLRSAKKLSVKVVESEGGISGSAEIIVKRPKERSAILSSIGASKHVQAKSTAPLQPESHYHRKREERTPTPRGEMGVASGEENVVGGGKSTKPGDKRAAEDEDEEMALGRRVVVLSSERRWEDLRAGSRREEGGGRVVTGRLHESSSCRNAGGGSGGNGASSQEDRLLRRSTSLKEGGRREGTASSLVSVRESGRGEGAAREYVRREEKRADWRICSSRSEEERFEMQRKEERMEWGRQIAGIPAGAERSDLPSGRYGGSNLGGVRVESGRMGMDDGPRGRRGEGGGGSGSGSGLGPRPQVCGRNTGRRDTGGGRFIDSSGGRREYPSANGSAPGDGLSPRPYRNNKVAERTEWKGGEEREEGGSGSGLSNRSGGREEERRYWQTGPSPRGGMNEYGKRAREVDGAGGGDRGRAVGKLSRLSASRCAVRGTGREGDVVVERGEYVEEVWLRRTHRVAYKGVENEKGVGVGDWGGAGGGGGGCVTPAPMRGGGDAHQRGGGGRRLEATTAERSRWPYRSGTGSRGGVFAGNGSQDPGVEEEGMDDDEGHEDDWVSGSEEDGGPHGWERRRNRERDRDRDRDRQLSLAFQRAAVGAGVAAPPASSSDPMDPLDCVEGRGGGGGGGGIPAPSSRQEARGWATDNLRSGKLTWYDGCAGGGEGEVVESGVGRKTPGGRATGSSARGEIGKEVEDDRSSPPLREQVGSGTTTRVVRRIIQLPPATGSSCRGTAGGSAEGQGTPLAKRSEEAESTGKTEERWGEGGGERNVRLEDYNDECPSQHDEQHVSTPPLALRHQQQPQAGRKKSRMEEEEERVSSFGGGDEITCSTEEPFWQGRLVSEGLVVAEVMACLVSSGVSATDVSPAAQQAESLRFREGVEGEREGEEVVEEGEGGGEGEEKRHIMDDAGRKERKAASFGGCRGASPSQRGVSWEFPTILDLKKDKQFGHFPIGILAAAAAAAAAATAATAADLEPRSITHHMAYAGKREKYIMAVYLSMFSSRKNILGELVERLWDDPCVFSASLSLKGLKSNVKALADGDDHGPQPTPGGVRHPGQAEGATLYLVPYEILKQISWMGGGLLTEVPMELTSIAGGLSPDRLSLFGFVCVPRESEESSNEPGSRQQHLSWEAGTAITNIQLNGQPNIADNGSPVDEPILADDPLCKGVSCVDLSDSMAQTNSADPDRVQSKKVILDERGIDAVRNGDINGGGSDVAKQSGLLHEATALEASDRLSQGEGKLGELADAACMEWSSCGRESSGALAAVLFVAKLRRAVSRRGRRAGGNATGAAGKRAFRAVTVAIQFVLRLRRAAMKTMATDSELTSSHGLCSSSQDRETHKVVDGKQSIVVMEEHDQASLRSNLERALIVYPGKPSGDEDKLSSAAAGADQLLVAKAAESMPTVKQQSSASWPGTESTEEDKTWDELDVKPQRKRKREAEDGRVNPEVTGPDAEEEMEEGELRMDENTLEKKRRLGEMTGRERLFVRGNDRGMGVSVSKPELAEQGIEDQQTMGLNAASVEDAKTVQSAYMAEECSRSVEMGGECWDRPQDGAALEEHLHEVICHNDGVDALPPSVHEQIQKTDPCEVCLMDKAEQNPVLCADGELDIKDGNTNGGLKRKRGEGESMAENGEAGKLFATKFGSEQFPDSGGQEDARVPTDHGWENEDKEVVEEVSLLDCDASKRDWLCSKHNLDYLFEEFGVNITVQRRGDSGCSQSGSFSCPDNVYLRISIKKPAWSDTSEAEDLVKKAVERVRVLKVRGPLQSYVWYKGTMPRVDDPVCEPRLAVLTLMNLIRGDDGRNLERIERQTGAAVEFVVKSKGGDIRTVDDAECTILKGLEVWNVGVRVRYPGRGGLGKAEHEAEGLLDSIGEILARNRGVAAVASNQSGVSVVGNGLGPFTAHVGGTILAPMKIAMKSDTRNGAGPESGISFEQIKLKDRVAEPGGGIAFSKVATEESGGVYMTTVFGGSSIGGRFGKRSRSMETEETNERDGAKEISDESPKATVSDPSDLHPEDGKRKGMDNRNLAEACADSDDAGPFQIVEALQCGGKMEGETGTVMEELGIEDKGNDKVITVNMINLNRGPAGPARSWLDPEISPGGGAGGGGGQFESSRGISCKSRGSAGNALVQTDGAWNTRQDEGRGERTHASLKRSGGNEDMMEGMETTSYFQEEVAQVKRHGSKGIDQRYEGSEAPGKSVLSGGESSGGGRGMEKADSGGNRQWTQSGEAKCHSSGAKSIEVAKAREGAGAGPSKGLMDGSKTTVGTWRSTLGRGGDVHEVDAPHSRDPKGSARSGEGVRQGCGAFGAQGGPVSRPMRDKETWRSTLYVVSLPRDANTHMLKRMFKQILWENRDMVPSLREVWSRGGEYVTDVRCLLSKGCAFVELAGPELVEETLRLFAERPLVFCGMHCELSKSTRDRHPREARFVQNGDALSNVNEHLHGMPSVDDGRGMRVRSPVAGIRRRGPMGDRRDGPAAADAICMTEEDIGPKQSCRGMDVQDDSSYGPYYTGPQDVNGPPHMRNPRFCHSLQEPVGWSRESERERERNPDFVEQDARASRRLGVPPHDEPRRWYGDGEYDDVPRSVYVKNLQEHASGFTVRSLFERVLKEHADPRMLSDVRNPILQVRIISQYCRYAFVEMATTELVNFILDLYTNKPALFQGMQCELARTVYRGRVHSSAEPSGDHAIERVDANEEEMAGEWCRGGSGRDGRGESAGPESAAHWQRMLDTKRSLFIDKLPKNASEPFIQSNFEKFLRMNIASLSRSGVGGCNPYLCMVRVRRINAKHYALVEFASREVAEFILDTYERDPYTFEGMRCKAHYDWKNQ